MNLVWTLYIAVGTLVSLLACFWLIVWTNRQRASDEEIAESESHVWDENVRELNNPLPMWWLWLFILTLIWGFGYFVLYPSLGNFAGTLGWSQEAQYEAEVAAAEARYGPLFARFGSLPVEELINDPDAMRAGASLYANYCSQCHGANALGAIGFANLTTGVFTFGGSPAQIEQTINNGRVWVMPPSGAILRTDEQVDEMIRFVRNIQDGMDTSSPAYAQYMSLCVACHGPTGEGNMALGGPNLADDIWVYGSSDAALRKTLLEGRNGVMPAHGPLLGPDRAHILAAYVHSLSR